MSIYSLLIVCPLHGAKPALTTIGVMKCTYIVYYILLRSIEVIGIKWLILLVLVFLLNSLKLVNFSLDSVFSKLHFKSTVYFSYAFRSKCYSEIKCWARWNQWNRSQEASIGMHNFSQGFFFWQFHLGA